MSGDFHMAFPELGNEIPNINPSPLFSLSLPGDYRNLAFDKEKAGLFADSAHEIKEHTSRPQFMDRYGDSTVSLMSLTNPNQDIDYLLHGIELPNI